MGEGMGEGVWEREVAEKQGITTLQQLQQILEILIIIPILRQKKTGPIQITRKAWEQGGEGGLILCSTEPLRIHPSKDVTNRQQRSYTILYNNTFSLGHFHEFHNLKAPMIPIMV